MPHIYATAQLWRNCATRAGTRNVGLTDLIQIDDTDPASLGAHRIGTEKWRAFGFLPHLGLDLAQLLVRILAPLNASLLGPLLAALGAAFLGRGTLEVNVPSLGKGVFRRCGGLFL